MVAREVSGKPKYEKQKLLKEIMENVNKSKEAGVYVRNFGPKQLTSFSTYERLFNKLNGMKGQLNKEFHDLLLGSPRLHFDGEPKFFVKHSKRWREALFDSLPEPGRQFARKLDALKKRKGLKAWNVVNEAIKGALLSRGSSPDLRRAAFAYGYLRCVYGLRDGQGNEDQTTEWCKPLLEALKRRTPALSDFTGLKSNIEDSKKKPKFQHMHKKISDRGTVLASMGFYAFYNLYIAHSPEVKNE